MARSKGKRRRQPDQTKVLASGEITLPPGSIPSPSGGKSSAIDFTHALMTGHPVAMEAASKALASADEPTVADKFISSTFEWCKAFDYTAKEEKKVAPILMAYRKAMRFAHRFVLDKEFVEYATELSSTVTPEKLLSRLGFATLPYETTWIEFDLHAKVRTMRRIHGLGGMPSGVGPRMGVLLERVNDTVATVTMVADGGKIVSPNLTGYVYSTDERTLRFDQMFNGLTPFDAAYRSDRLKKMPLFADVMSDPESAGLLQRVSHGALWGFGDSSGVLSTTREMIDHIRIPEFLMRHGELAFSRFYDFFENADRTRLAKMGNVSKVISDEITEFSGMMRWLVIVLAMLNEVPTRSQFVQPQHTMRAGLTRRVAAFDYHMLTLRLPKTRPVPYLERKLSNVERRHKAHEVRQHWRTYLHDQHCATYEHVWEYDHENGYALCGRCMGYRRRIPEHVRGDASLGWTHKDYSIKRSRQE